MPDKQPNLNEILYKINSQFCFKMTLIGRPYNKASLELKMGKRAYRVDYIEDHKNVFRSFLYQHEEIIRDGFQASVFIHFFANKQREWMLQINRYDETIEISLNKVLSWQRLVNKFSAVCDISEYINALYAFVQNLPDQTDKKGGIEK